MDIIKAGGPRSLMEKRQVVITGLGVITPIGIGAASLWEGLRHMRSAVRTLSRFDASVFRSRMAAEVNAFVPTDLLGTKPARRLDRFGQFAVAAARMALQDAALDPARENRDRIGAMMGSALGGVAHAEAQVSHFLDGGVRAVDPRLALAVFAGAASCNIAIEFGLRGPNSTNAMSCTSGTIAIGDAFRQIRDGYADVMLAGGAEAPLAPLCYGAFTLIRAMSTRNGEPARASRPFDRERDGFVMGEGAAVLVLEAQDRAVARGARVYGEVAGYGLTNDGHHMTHPLEDGSQAARAMRLALKDAGIRPEEVDYLNAHGSSTVLNDATETTAIRQVFGEHTRKLLVSGTKGYYGHPLGASGAIEAAICAQVLACGWVPPTVNLEVPDQVCELRHVDPSGMLAHPACVVSNSFGFGGVNATVVLRQTG